ncbi:unnamed protein product [Clonostachys rosea f. rosea IK726]|uniref:Uncharacterized protein n=1 Tax=Clonostachys rosea f. rosea IK726 TaxID=1349383 RepID=A0ACA9USX2_BIOOC|nr:unnamed protein product [Clonostachys rosea f. rosea IK726]
MGSLATEQLHLTCEVLDQRFADLKQSLIKPENKQKVIESYARLVKVLKAEVDHIAKFGPALVPEIDFNEIRKNSGILPPDFASCVHERGCIILRNVVSEERAVKWETSLKDYIQRHPGIGGHPKYKPAAWNLFWSKAQMECSSRSYEKRF